MGNANMTQERAFDSLQPQLLEGEVLLVEEMARLCCVTTDWLHTRIEQEVIHAVHREGAYYLSSATVVRVQQVAQIEQTYDADPQLAALVADLVEEVQHLRRQLKR
jgi:chaperone modulatory protein CbpM